MDSLHVVRWSGDAVRIVDQRALPGEFVERDLRTLDDVCEAITTLSVRGAPVIGITAALGLAMLAERAARESPATFVADVERAAARLRATRPTAVNLAWALDRVLAHVRAPGVAPRDAAAALRRDADAILEEDRAMRRRIGEHGLALIPDGARVLTHCNAGALATGGLGTALAPLYLAAERGQRIEVIANETRPLFQGSRLTAWELSRAGIPVTVIVDSAAASEMRAGRIDCCIVGADRIAANGDVANKIGTYPVAVAARYHGIPFYVAAPTSTIDPDAPTGAGIRIEERSREELAAGLAGGHLPDGVAVRNPAFDVTPAALISAIVTDRGVFRPPYDFSRVDRDTARDASRLQPAQ